MKTEEELKGIFANHKIWANLVYQLLAHVYALSCNDDDFKKIQELIKPFAEKSHKWNDLNEGGKL